MLQELILFFQKHRVTYRNFRYLMLFTIDSILVNIGFVLFFLVRLEANVLNTYYKELFLEILLPKFTPIYIASFLFTGLYRCSLRFANLTTVISILRAVSLGTMLTIIYAFLFLQYVPMPPRSIFFAQWFFILVLITLSRSSIVMLKYILVSTIRPTHEKAIILGDARTALAAIEAVARFQENYPRIVGLLVENSMQKGQTIGNVPVLGTFDNLEKVLKNKTGAKVIIASQNLPGSKLREITQICRKFHSLPQTIHLELDPLTKKPKQFSLQSIEISDLLKRSPASLNTKVIKNYISDKTILVTGAGGSIGSELSLQILDAKPKKLILIDCSEFNLYQIVSKLSSLPCQSTEMTHYLLDIKELDELENSVFKTHKIDFVIHAAAFKHVPLVEANPQFALRNNIQSTRNLALLCNQYRVHKMVFISTDKAVRPTSIMGASKRVCEKLIQSINKDPNNYTEFMAVRFGNVLGSSGSVIPLFIDQLNQGVPITITHPEMTRFFMLIPEAVQLVLQAMTIGRKGDILILDMGEPVNIMEMAKELCFLMGKNNTEFKITGLRPGEKLYEEIIIEGSEDPTCFEDIFIAKNQDNWDPDKYISDVEELLQLCQNTPEQAKAINKLRSLVRIFTLEELET